MKKTIFFIFLFLMIFSVCVNADYNITLGSEGDGDTGSGVFTSSLVGSTSNVYRALGDAWVHPLVADLDGDGRDEIVVIDGNQIEIYENNSLNLLDSAIWINSGYGDVRYITNPVTEDLDGDGYSEIIFYYSRIAAPTTDLMLFWEYDGTNLYHDYNYTMTDLANDKGTDSEGNGMIGCRSADCLVIKQQTGWISFGNELYANAVNSVTNDTRVTLDNCGANDCQWCFPKINRIQTEDYDNDGNIEYIFSALKTFDTVPGGTSVYQIYYVSVDASLNVALENIIEIDAPTSFIQNQDCDYRNWSSFISSPLVADLDNSVGNGLETAIAYRSKFNVYTIEAYDSTYQQIDSMQGEDISTTAYLSNILLMNAIPGTVEYGKKDFCVQINDFEQSKIQLLCGSLLGGLFSYDTYKYTYDVPFNITTGERRLDTIIHSGQHTSTLYGGEQLDELINSIGVFELNFNSCSTNDCSMLLKFWNPVGEGVVIMDDYQDIGYSDMIVQTEELLAYIDDEQENSPGYIQTVSFNPCQDAIWKVNTTVQMAVTVYDADNDKVSANVTAYLNTGHEINLNWSTNVTSMTPLLFEFTANKTISSGTIRVSGRDTENPTTVDIEDFSFSVGKNGVEFGDSSCTYGSLAPDTGDTPTTNNTEENLSTEPGTGNYLDQSVGQLNTKTGLGTTVIWLLVMVGLAVLIWIYRPQDKDILTPIILISFLEILLLIIGVKQGYIPFGIIILITVIGVTAIGIWLSKKFAAGHQGMG